MLHILPTLLIFIATAASGMTIEHNVKDMRPILPLSLDLEMSGPIESGDAARFAAILGSYNDQSFREINITLNSPGGSLAEGL